ncbi:hypothetical protein HYU18_02300, partial [Candidatus Woesearchaeota archaeon]|nr:hypothetical protein [Candidatus Woesearchaeota archaeon]
IVLIVLVILVMITTGYFGNVFGPTFGELSKTSCSGRGGTVISESGYCSWPTEEKSGFYDDVSDGQKCCLPLSCGERGGNCKAKCSPEETGYPWPCDGKKVCCVKTVSEWD